MSQNEFALAYQADAGPVVAEARETAGQLVARAAALAVADAVTYQESGELILELKRKKKDYDEKRMDLTRPLDALKAKWMGFFKPVSDALEQAITSLEGRRTSYRREKEAEELRVREAALKERARLERIAEREAQKLEASGQQERADLVRASVPEVAVPSVVPQEMPKTAGLHARENWTWGCAICEAKDCEHLVKRLPREHLAVNEASVGKVVRALKGMTKIPGIVVWMEESSVAGRGAF